MLVKQLQHTSPFFLPSNYNLQQVETQCQYTEFTEAAEKVMPLLVAIHDSGVAAHSWHEERTWKAANNCLFIQFIDTIYAVLYTRLFKKNITTSTHAEHTTLLLPEMLNNYVEKQISFM